MSDHIAPERHILFAIHPRMGHLRPAIAIAVKLLSETPNLIITLPVVLSMTQDVSSEIARHAGIEENRHILLKNIRIVPVGPLVPKEQSYRAFIQEFEPLYSVLTSGKSYVSSNGQYSPAIRPPEVCMMDFIFYDVMQTVRRLTENIPIFVFSFGSTALTLRILLRGDVPLRAERMSKETGRGIDDILLEIYQPNKGQVKSIPGLLPMYDYEAAPHITPNMLKLLAYLGPKSYNSLQDCNGIITTSNRVYEPEAIAALEQHLSETNRPLYVLPTLGLAAEDNFSRTEITTIAFLDRVLNKCGERSLFYVVLTSANRYLTEISFGSVFWPPNVPAVWKILEILLESNIPMIISHDDQRATMPEPLQSLLASSVNVFTTPWASQELILEHKATGWFLTHCGQNSVTEALSRGIPMIAWPIDTDQPLNAAYLSLKLDVAYELLEVRTGNGLRPLYRGITPEGTLEAVEKEFRSILKLAWGADGQRKRENAEEFKRKLSILWNENGEPRKDLRRFIADWLT